MLLANQHDGGAAAFIQLLGGGARSAGEQQGCNRRTVLRVANGEELCLGTAAIGGTDQLTQALVELGIGGEIAAPIA